MGKFFKVLGILSGILILFMGISAGWAFFSVRGLDEESKNWVVTSVKPVLESWSADKLVQLSSIELITVAPKEKIEELMKVLSEKLGKFESLGEPKGEAHVDVNNLQKTITAQYDIPVKFSGGDGKLVIHAIKKDEGWQFLQFHIDSNALFGLK